MVKLLHLQAGGSVSAERLAEVLLREESSEAATTELGTDTESKQESKETTGTDVSNIGTDTESKQDKETTGTDTSNTNTNDLDTQTSDTAVTDDTSNTEENLASAGEMASMGATEKVSPNTSATDQDTTTAAADAGETTEGPNPHADVTSTRLRARVNEEATRLCLTMIREAKERLGAQSGCIHTVTHVMHTHISAHISTL